MHAHGGEPVTANELVEQIAKAAEISEKAAEQLTDATWEAIARELSVGEEVAIENLGRFFTVKEPSHTVDGNITLPSIEVEFEPSRSLMRVVEDAEEDNPELFKDELPDMPGDDSEPDSSDEESAASIDEQSEDDTRAATPDTAIAKEEEKTPEKPLGRVSSIEFIDATSIKIDKEILQILPEHIAKQYSVVPLDLNEGVLTVGMINPDDFDALQIIRKETGLSIKPALTTKDGINAVLDQYTGLQAEVQEVIDNSDLGISKQDLQAAQEEDIDQTNDDAPTAHIVYSLLKRAVKEKASDIHIEPYEAKVIVRFRIDGVLMEKATLPKEIQSAITARLKILAALKIDEQRLPQDGRFSITMDKRQVDFRFSTIPVVYGEKIVMRILDKQVGIIDLEEVGVTGHGYEVLTKNMRRSHGMILVTGPTGSGKTTSLYAVLGKMMAPDVNILTLEDPVEYRIESINQSQVHAAIGYTFASGLRAVVRQDPDIVMLGEIRDSETADMAIHAALTGHIVLSTLHTNDAAGAFPRLIDMGIEPFLITSSIHTVIAQRLARKVCQDCREQVHLSEAELEEIEVEIRKMPEQQRNELDGKPREFWHGKGCDTCGGKGYKGRIGVFEVLDVTEPIRELVLKRSSGSLVSESAVGNGMVTMVQDGIMKALKGDTTIEEVWRVTRE
jgi:type II secretory ATPase GspE/PulE/Tfp pilus assembly ATPase PilB-like protein/nucleoid DNA-binding protein